MTGKPTPKLTPKQRQFVAEYLIDLNATRAAIRAGYSLKTAGQQGFENLRKSSIQAAIRTALETRGRATGVSAERVLLELARLGFANMLDYITVQADGTAHVDLSALDRDRAAAIAEVTVEEDVVANEDGSVSHRARKVKFKLADKKPVLELLARHVGLRVGARLEHTGAGGGPIRHEQVTPDDVRRELIDIFAEADGAEPGPGDPPLH